MVFKGIWHVLGLISCISLGGSSRSSVFMAVLGYFMLFPLVLSLLPLPGPRDIPDTKGVEGGPIATCRHAKRVMNDGNEQIEWKTGSQKRKSVGEEMENI